MQSEKMMLNERRQRMWQDRVATAAIQLGHPRTTSALHMYIILYLCGRSSSCAACEGNNSQLAALGEKFRDGNNDIEVRSSC